MERILMPKIVIDSYPSGSVDFFQQVYAPANISALGLIAEMITSIKIAIRDLNKIVFVTIAGHSDRVDDPNMNTFQRHNLEFDASNKRAFSAADFIISMIATECNINYDQAMKNPYWSYSVEPCGAANLSENHININSAQRLKNRRVEISGTVFNF